MEVKIQRSGVIAASPLGEHSPLPLTVFDRFAPDIHIAVLFAFSPPTPTNSKLIESLSQTLLHYYPTFTGCFTGTARMSCIIPGSGGALVVESNVDSNLEEHLPLLPIPELTHLHPSTSDASHLLQVQLNRFRCGGLIIGVTNHHRVADGRSISNFYISWCKVCRGAPVEMVPNLDRSWLQPRSPPECEFEHWGAEFIAPPALFTLNQSKHNQDSFSNVLLHYSDEFINSNLKSGLKEKLTTFQLVLGHVWRKITIARGLGHGETTMLSITVNSRARLHPSVPIEFTGNVVLNASPAADAGELIEKGPVSAARIIREAIQRIDGKYLQSFIDFGQQNRDENLVPVYEQYGRFLLPNLEVDSWLGFQFEAVDFGSGTLRAFVPTWVPMDGLVIFLPSLREDGGVDVVVALLSEHAEILKTISHSLD